MTDHILDIEDPISIYQATREIAIVTDERLKLATLRLADWKEPMEAAEKELRQQIAELRDKYQAAHAELIKNHDESLTKFYEADKAHRAAIVALYEVQDDKDLKSNIIPGWGVAVGEDIQVDEPTAVQWLIEHDHREALKLDATKFKKLAEVLKPDFVKFRPKVTAKITPIKGAK